MPNRPGYIPPSRRPKSEVRRSRIFPRDPEAYPVYLSVPKSLLKLTIRRAHLQPGLDGAFILPTDAQLDITCHCGTSYTARVSDFYARNWRARSCGCLGRRRLARATRPPSEAVAPGATVGRLKLLRWIPRIGWLCECSGCGHLVMYRTTRSVMLACMRECHRHKAEERAAKGHSQ
jgi:hypothetical protein